MKKYKYITIKPAEHETLFHGKICYGIYNNKSNALLGLIFFDDKWKQYVFTQAQQDIIFSAGCLKDITDFMENVNKK